MTWSVLFGEDSLPFCLAVPITRFFMPPCIYYMFTWHN